MAYLAAACGANNDLPVAQHDRSDLLTSAYIIILFNSHHSKRRWGYSHFEHARTDRSIII